MNVAPRFVEGSYLEHHEIERPVLLSDRAKLRREPRVTAEEDTTFFGRDHPGRPERTIPIERTTTGEMPRRRGREREGTKRRRLPPVELRDPLRPHALRRESRTDAERR